MNSDVGQHTYVNVNFLIANNEEIALCLSEFSRVM